MTLSLLITAWVMGLVGGPHCVAMCAAPCHAIAQGHYQALDRLAPTSQSAPACRRSTSSTKSSLQLQLGRLLGYAALGAVAATAVEQLAWFSDRSSWLHPVWVVMHLAVLAWGLAMLFGGAQPRWLEQAGRKVWAYAQPVLRMPAGAWLAGMAWALMPCGLLYSAVLVAALSGSATAGAASMGAFAVGGALWLWMAPKVWQTLHARINTRRAGWGTRAAGGMLVGVALAALWTDLIVQPNAWCR